MKRKLAALLAALILAGCAGSEEPPVAPLKRRVSLPLAAPVQTAIMPFRDGSVEHIRTMGFLRVGADDTTGPPFIYWGGAQGREQINGFEVQIAQRLARSLGVNLRIVATPWLELRHGLETNRFDVIINGQELPDDPRHRPDLFYSRPYYHSSQSIVVRVGERRIWQLQDLMHKRVGVLEAGVGSAIIQELNDQKGLGISGRSYRKLEPLLAELASGYLDAAILDAPLASWHLRGRSPLKSVGNPILPRPYTVVGRADDRQLEAAVNAVLLQTDKIRPLLQYWSLWNTIQPGYPGPMNSKRTG